MAITGKRTWQLLLGLVGLVGMALFAAWWSSGQVPPHVPRLAAAEPGQPDPGAGGSPSAKNRKPKLADQLPGQAGGERGGASSTDGSGRETSSAPSKEESSASNASSPPTPGESDQPMLENPFPRRQLAPSLDGGVAWINTSRPLDLQDLRGKFVVLDFWTYCCINCMHVLPVLKQLEHAYPNNLVVIGVHSAKFEGEQDSKNITDAVQRYEIEHPVINDAEHVLWNKYFSQSWPSLRVIDPQGYLVAVHSGEIAFEDLDRFIKQALPYYRQQGLLDELQKAPELAADPNRPALARIIFDAATKSAYIAAKF